MLETKFLSAGSNEEDALRYACDLTAILFLELDSSPKLRNIDINCKSAKEAEKLDELMWSYPIDALIPHKLTHKKGNKMFAEIGYPGSKFTFKENKALVNLNPDLPNQISEYLIYFQLVIEDNSSLRNRAADTWDECKSMGLKPSFVRNYLYEKEL